MRHWHLILVFHLKSCSRHFLIQSYLWKGASCIFIWVLGIILGPKVQAPIWNSQFVNFLLFNKIILFVFIFYVEIKLCSFSCYKLYRSLFWKVDYFLILVTSIHPHLPSLNITYGAIRRSYLSSLSFLTSFRHPQTHQSEKSRLR